MKPTVPEKLDEKTLNQIVQALEQRKSETTKKRTTEKQPPPQEKPPKQETPRESPAKTFTNGSVTTRIWANKTTIGEVIWRIDQRRLRSDGVGGAVCKTLQPQHLSDAMQGLQRASRWIKKTERRLRFRRLWP